MMMIKKKELCATTRHTTAKQIIKIFHKKTLGCTCRLMETSKVECTTMSYPKDNKNLLTWKNTISRIQAQHILLSMHLNILYLQTLRSVCFVGSDENASSLWVSSSFTQLKFVTSAKAWNTIGHKTTTEKHQHVWLHVMSSGVQDEVLMHS